MAAADLTWSSLCEEVEGKEKWHKMQLVKAGLDAKLEEAARALSPKSARKHRADAAASPSSGSIGACLAATLVDRPRRAFAAAELARSFVWLLPKPDSGGQAAPVRSASDLHVTSSFAARETKDSYHRGRRPAAPAPPAPVLPRGGRKRGRPTSTAPPQPALHQAPKRTRSEAPAPPPAPPPAAAPLKHRSAPPMDAEMQAAVDTALANPSLNPTPDAAAVLAEGMGLTAAALGEVLVPATKRAIGKLIKWTPKGGDNFFKYKISAAWVQKHALDYLSVVTNPMDLATMRARIMERDPTARYTSVADFEADVRLIATNASLYNGESSYVTHAAGELIGEFYDNVFPELAADAAAAIQEAKMRELDANLATLRADAAAQARASVERSRRK